MTWFNDVKEFWKKAIKRECHFIARLEFSQIFRDIKHWWHYRHDAWKDEFTFNEDTGRFRIDRATIPMSEVSPYDLPITGAKYRAFKTDLKAPPNDEVRTEEIDGQAVTFVNTTPASDYLFFVNNDMNDSLTGTFKAGGLDPKIILVLVGLGALGLIYFLFFR